MAEYSGDETHCGKNKPLVKSYTLKVFLLPLLNVLLGDAAMRRCSQNVWVDGWQFWKIAELCKRQVSCHSETQIFVQLVSLLTDHVWELEKTSGNRQFNVGSVQIPHKQLSGCVYWRVTRTPLQLIAWGVLDVKMTSRHSQNLIKQQKKINPGMHDYQHTILCEGKSHLWLPTHHAIWWEVTSLTSLKWLGSIKRLCGNQRIILSCVLFFFLWLKSR